MTERKKTYQIRKTGQESINGFRCTSLEAETTHSLVSFVLVERPDTEDFTVAGLRELPFPWRGRLKKYASYLAREPTMKEVRFTYW